jgi:hypothetical protein
LLTTLSALPACVRPLLSPDDKRTPFDAFDAVRGQQSPQQMTNEFGRQEVNLRQRLAPKERPREVFHGVSIPVRYLARPTRTTRTLADRTTSPDWARPRIFEQFTSTGGGASDFGR